jgi:hypothetical protein
VIERNKSEISHELRARVASRRLGRSGGPSDRHAIQTRQRFLRLEFAHARQESIDNAVHIGFVHLKVTREIEAPLVQAVRNRV